MVKYFDCEWQGRAQRAPQIGSRLAIGWQPAPHSGKPQTVLALLRRCTLLDVPNPQPHQRRNAMQQFIDKFEKDIQGVLSGFDRVLFRGTLPRLSYSEGMKMYLIQNKILCKHYEDHVKAVSRKVKKASLAPFQQQGLLVKHVYGRDDKEQIARAG